MATGRISPLQMTDATDWKGMTTENHLGALWAREPQKVSDMVTMIHSTTWGNNLDSVLAKFPTLYFETDDDFTWQLQSKAINNIELIEARIDGTAITPADQVGKNYTTFELVFAKDKFSHTQRIVGELNELYPIYITEEPRREGMNTVYVCRLDTGDPNMFMPYDELVAGKKFSGEYSPVERMLSRKGREINFKSMFAMRNGFSQIRIQKKSPGNMSKRKMGCFFKTQDGQVVKVWQQYESWLLDMEFREDINRLFMFGTSNRAADGTYKLNGVSGNEIVEGSGIRQQMETANTSFYNYFDIDDFANRLLDLSEGKIATDMRKFVARCGERGSLQFHKGLERYSQLFIPLVNSDRMYKATSNVKGIDIPLGFGGQFVEYKGPNGVMFSVSVDSMYDDRTRNKLLHPNGGVAESYRYDLLDIGTNDGAPNIQKVEVTGQPKIHKYIAGLRNPYDPDGAFSAIGTAEDAWEEHMFYTGAAIVRDPSRTASFIPNILAGYLR